jgi:hypothetical protein
MEQITISGHVFTGPKADKEDILNLRGPDDTYVVQDCVFDMRHTVFKQDEAIDGVTGAQISLKRCLFLGCEKTLLAGNGAMIVQVDGGFEIQACPSPTAHELSTALRSQRDAKLGATDKYLLADYPISPEELEAIKNYRQLLRDLPAQPGAPWDGGGSETPWPEKPIIKPIDN